MMQDSKPAAENGFAKKPADLAARVKTPDGLDLGSGDVLIAAITSCTNTSNPGVLLAAMLASRILPSGASFSRMRTSPSSPCSMAAGG